MEMPLGGFWQCPVTDANEIIARAGAKSGKLHYVKIPHAAAYRIRRGNLPRRAAPASDGHVSVSYTHLDVYKRQAFRSAGRARFFAA